MVTIPNMLKKNKEAFPKTIRFMKLDMGSKTRVIKLTGLHMKGLLAQRVIKRLNPTKMHRTKMTFISKAVTGTCSA